MAVGMMFNPFAGAMTPEERKYWLEQMPDITAAEDDMAMNRAYAKSLREQTPFRRDVASQLNRGLKGALAPIAEQEALESNKRLGEQLRRAAQGAPGMTPAPQSVVIDQTRRNPWDERVNTGLGDYTYNG